MAKKPKSTKQISPKKLKKLLEQCLVKGPRWRRMLNDPEEPPTWRDVYQLTLNTYAMALEDVLKALNGDSRVLERTCSVDPAKYGSGRPFFIDPRRFPWRKQPGAGTVPPGPPTHHAGAQPPPGSTSVPTGGVVAPDSVPVDAFTTAGAELVGHEVLQPEPEALEHSDDGPELNVPGNSSSPTESFSAPEENKGNDLKPWETIEPAIRTSSLESLDSVMPWAPKTKPEPDEAEPSDKNGDEDIEADPVKD